MQVEAEPRDRLRELEARGWLRRPAEGVVLFSGPLLDLRRRFDAAFRALAVGHGAEEWSAPCLLPRQMADRIDYVDNFRGTLLRTSAMDRAPDATSHLLLPSACFHLYPELEGVEVAADPGRVLTCAARVFRNEERSDRFGRLVEFSVREVLFFGSAERVDRIKRGLLLRTERLATDAGLDWQTVDAVDPFFFFLGDRRAKRDYDIPANTKKELAVRVPAAAGRLALASFNLHGTFFTGHFEMTAVGGDRLYSGCCGFGLERWTLAFAATHGADPEQWPPFAPPGRPGPEEP